MLFQPEVDESPKNILNALNEYCLREILVRLGLIDLCSVAKTCKSLHQIVEKVFESKYKNKCIDLCDLVQNGKTTLVEYLLGNFGSSITSINLDDGLGVQCDAVVQCDQHCKNIKSLCFYGHVMKNVTINNYSEMLGRLETLHIIGGFLGVNRLLKFCSQLKVLEAMMIDCLNLTDVTRSHFHAWLNLIYELSNAVEWVNF